MKVTYDPLADAAYIYLVDIAPGDVAETYPGHPGDKLVAGINLDFDSSQRLIGIEVLNARRTLPQAVIQEAELLS
jgi:uncharacterized protein YuzE